MPTATYTPLANITLGATVSTITFGSIPNTYRDLVIVFVGTGSASIAGQMRFNSDSGTNYNEQRMTGDGSTGSAARRTNRTAAAFSINAFATTTSALQATINIFDYSATNKHKMSLSRGGNAANATEAIVSRWRNTGAITSVQLSPTSSTFAIGTTVALYGIVS